MAARGKSTAASNSSEDAEAKPRSKAEALEDDRVAAMEKPLNEVARDRMREVFAKRGRKS